MAVKNLNIKVYDSGEDSCIAGRFTVIYLDFPEDNFKYPKADLFICISMDENAGSLFGNNYCQHSSAAMPYNMVGDEKEIQFENLPENCQEIVLKDLGEID